MRDILRSVAREKQLFLFLDYDGTLVPIRRRPELAVLRPARRKILERLSREAVVGIVSGRSLADIQRQIALPGVAYIGNHGFEISYRRRRWVHPQARKRSGDLRAVLARLRRRTRHMPGVIIEGKDLTGSVHFRLLKAARVPELREIVSDEVRRGRPGLKLTAGKKVLEIRPDVDWDKGRGVLELCRWLRLRSGDLRIYIGDDETDADAFRALRRDSLTIVVGRDRSIHAKYRVADVTAVWNLLRSLLAILPARGPEDERVQGP